MVERRTLFASCTYFTYFFVLSSDIAIITAYSFTHFFLHWNPGFWIYVSFIPFLVILSVLMAWYSVLKLKQVHLTQAAIRQVRFKGKLRLVFMVALSIMALWMLIQS